MKSGFYFNLRAPFIYLHYGDGAAISINVISGEIDRIGGLERLSTRPAVKQDIIDYILPLISEKKEPGQVAFEAFYGGLQADWKGASLEGRTHWINVERAVLEANKP
jgi:hypothetical protein